MTGKKPTTSRVPLRSWSRCLEAERRNDEITDGHQAANPRRRSREHALRGPARIQGWVACRESECIDELSAGQQPAGVGIRSDGPDDIHVLTSRRGIVSCQN